MSTKLKGPGKRGSSRKKSKKKKVNVLSGADDAVDSFYDEAKNNKPIQNYVHADNEPPKKTEPASQPAQQMEPKQDVKGIIAQDNADQKDQQKINETPPVVVQHADNDETIEKTKVSLFNMANVNDSGTDVVDEDIVDEELSDVVDEELSGDDSIENTEEKEEEQIEKVDEKQVEKMDKDTKKEETDGNMNDKMENNTEEVINDVMNDANDTNDAEQHNNNTDEQQATDESVVTNISKIGLDQKESIENVEKHKKYPIKPTIPKPKLPFKSKSKPLPKAPVRPLPLRSANSCTPSDEKEDKKESKPPQISMDSLNEPNVDKAHQSWVISKTPPPPQVPSLTAKQLSPNQLKPLTPTNPKPPTPTFDPKALDLLSPKAKRALLKRKEQQKEVESLTL